MSYKLYYFPVRGNAELIRYIFADAGQKYEDIRLTGDSWTEFKPKTPVGQLPVLEYDGKMLAQSFAIARFVAKKLGYYEGSDWDKAQIDSFLYLIKDIATPLMKLFFEKDPEAKAQLEKDFKDTTLPRFMPPFEKALADKDFLVGSKVSFTDFALFDMMTRLERMGFEFSAFPRCIAHRDRINKRPNIAKWIKERPDSQN